MNKVIDKGFRSCRFVSTIVKHPVLLSNFSRKTKDYYYFMRRLTGVSQSAEEQTNVTYSRL